ncbi:23S rRNA (guanosine(2251)-2'-O)-methyltransferase RlmB [Neorickettsia sennetsu]|uniref:RNA methyltransferase, TrmH family, group 3 n=1 Tax=Ehrlichia sennetsu (strain ATCC VR-367 / Miyayama) TaxID=222891 RepID=Q2GEE1_EHRS3|nr:23S rRNA (guanosine(2251)-2'-O)-methyltransferase RlmB [Neorickettsia sennetsu]ABD45803.1 RNA methyltransferase, TrmH family, group 3 [Neorickettsia sennetsu str. Miyayama]
MQQEKVVIFGKHAAVAAIKNPERNILSIFIAREKKAVYLPLLERSRLPNISFCENTQIAKICGRDALHQGIAVVTEKLSQPELRDVLKSTSKRSLVIILDSITDPFNIGNILRSSKAFGVDALVVKERHSPSETSVIAKTASGALESIPVCTIANLTNAVKILQENGYFCYALDGGARSKLTEIRFPNKVAFVLGSEGKGISHLLKTRCDQTLSIPMYSDKNFDSINVSNAAAIAMFRFYSAE